MTERAMKAQRSADERSKKQISFLPGGEGGSFRQRQIDEIMTGCLSSFFQLLSPSVTDKYSVFEGELVQ